MSKVIIVGTNVKQLATYLTSISDVDVEIFEDVYALNDMANRTQFRVDTILLRDTGLQNNRTKDIDVNTAGSIFMNTLRKQTFQVDRIIHLNKTENNAQRSFMEFLSEAKDIPDIEIVIDTRDKHIGAEVKALLMKRNLKFDELNIKYKHIVVKNKSNTGRRAGEFQQFETDKAVILEHNTFNPDTQSAVKSVRDILGDKPIENKVIKDSEIEEIENIDIDSFTEVKANKELPQTKIIGVMGEPRSGSTISSMVLGVSGSKFHKTLLIDANYDNMGLTYLVEKTLLDDEVNNIKVSDMITSGDSIGYIKNTVFDKRQLHILTINLPVKQVLEKTEYYFLLANIVKSQARDYAYIVIDLPLSDLRYATNLSTMFSDIILTTPPYMNNVMSMISAIDKSLMPTLPIYQESANDNSKHIKIMRTDVFQIVNRGISPVTSDVINNYTETLLGKRFDVTGITRYDTTSYINRGLFQQLLLSEEVK